MEPRLAARQKAALKKALQKARGQLSDRLLPKFSFFVCKCGLGFLKFAFEDLLNAATQAAFAVKFCDDLSVSMKCFTVGSLATGLLLSVAGPVKDCWLAGQVKRAGDMSWTHAVFAPDPPRATSHSQGLATHQRDLVRGAAAEQSDEGEAFLGSPPTSCQVKSVPCPDIPLTEDVGSPLPGGTSSHVILVLCALTYWGFMGLIPVMFASQISGGTSAAVPSSAVLLFTLVTAISLLAEQWVAIQTARGLTTVRGFPQLLLAGKPDKATLMPLLGVMLSIFGRYDTFCDVIFAIILCKTEPITEIVFENTLHRTVNIRLPLHWVAVGSLLVGVLFMQSIPGLYLLSRKRNLGAAFKLNEFCVLLALAEHEMN